MVRDLGLSANVWFPGWLSELDLYRHLAVADVGIDASQQPEVTPVKALEYLGVGLPLVAYDVQETRRLAHGAGVLVAAGDTEALAREVAHLLDNPDERARLGHVGEERVRLHMAWERQSEIYRSTVADLLTDGPARARASAPESPTEARTARP